MNGSNDPIYMSYFAPLLPWQSSCWNNLVARSDQLPHGLLFSGMQGIGKRAFVWRFVAWFLCENRLENRQQACGHCQSCHWLVTGTHPNLRVLPDASMPIAPNENSRGANKKQSVSKKKSNTKDRDDDKKSTSIKVDDIRLLQPFINQGSSGLRVCVIDNAETMTVAAANALLKTLEEPSDGVFLFLISDAPAKLLPTIKSRVQKVAIDFIERDKVSGYLADLIKANKILIDNLINSLNQNVVTEQDLNETELNDQINQLLSLANGAPLSALDMLASDWYQNRNVWLNTWLALRTGKRSSTAASDYWQKNLSLKAFIILSEIMLMDIYRCCVGLPILQQDLKLDSYPSVVSLKTEPLQSVMNEIEDIKLASVQNVQEKVAYDKIMSLLQYL